MATATKGKKNQKIEATEAQAVLDSVKGLALQQVIGEVGDLQVTVQNTLAGLSAALTSKIQQLQQCDQAITLKEQRLKELHGIEAEAITLDDMKAQKEAEQQAWEKEREDRENQWNEEVAERAKTWKRQEDERNYDVLTKTKRATDEFEATVSANKRAEQARQETLLKSWNEREEALKSQEQEFTNLQTQVAGFEARLESEVKKAEAILSNVLKRQYEHEAALLRKDAEAEKSMNAVKVSALNDTIQNLEQQVQDLGQQLVQARSDAKEVASQALQSASGRQVADALQQVVSSQASQPGKTK